MDKSGRGPMCLANPVIDTQFWEPEMGKTGSHRRTLVVPKALGQWSQADRILASLLILRPTGECFQTLVGVRDGVT